MFVTAVLCCLHRGKARNAIMDDRGVQLAFARIISYRDKTKKISTFSINCISYFSLSPFASSLAASEDTKKALELSSTKYEVHNQKKVYSLLIKYNFSNFDS